MSDLPPADRTYRTVNPATGVTLRQFPPLTSVEVEHLISEAERAHRVWREVTLTSRIALFSRIAHLLEDKAQLLGRQVTTEMGKVLTQSMQEVHVAASIFRYYGAHAEELLAEETIEVEGYSQVTVRRESLGVVLGIEPWNAPLFQAMRVAAPNLMLGNTVLLKPSELCAGSSLMLEEILGEAGVPAGVYQTALLSVSQVSDLIDDPRVRAVTLTGSDRAGTAIGEQAGRNVKPAILELGGSDAFIVLESADIDNAVATLTSSRLFISGQVCGSPKRIILADAIAEQFVEKLVENFANQTVGDPFDSATTVGPLSSIAAATTLQRQYDDAVEKGATVLLAGGKVDGPGAFFRPAILTDLSPDMKLYHEEAFGPLALVYRVANTEEAISLANDSVYGLGATVFSEDADEAERTASRLDVGSVGINGWICGPVETPFGGTKRSGHGRELGRTGMDQFANIKTYALS